MIFIGRKSHENTLVSDISWKRLIGAKLLRIRNDKVDGFIRVYDGTRFSVLFGGEKYDFIRNRVTYLIRVKNGIAYVISHNYAIIKVDSYELLPLQESLILHNVIILIKSVFNKDKNNYYCKMFLVKGSFQLRKNYDNKRVFV